MQVVKVSTPWTHIDFNTRVSNLHTASKYTFDFSDTCRSCDFWIVWGGIKTERETVECPPQNVIYLTDEVHEGRFFNKNFLDQFAAIITCRTDIDHQSVIASHELNTWMVDKDFDSLYTNDTIPKTKVLSVVCSDQTWLPGHKLRYAFVNKLIGHFKDKLDVFGRGFNPITDKYDALAPYKYSIAIENAAMPGYFTEKITDCYLTHTFPIYYGCPDIDTYFDPASFLLIEPLNYKESILKIEQLIEVDTFQKVLPLLQLEKRKYLNEYHIFNRLEWILENQFAILPPRQAVCIKGERYFQRGYPINNLLNKIFNKASFLRKWQFNITFNQADLYANKAK